jgi:hypothetical protein
MSRNFRVHELRGREDDGTYADVGRYLYSVYNFLNNTIHVSTRVYTCRFKDASAGVLVPYELHWNDDEVPGERFLGSFHWAPEKALVKKIENEFDKEKAVRLFIFDSDAELRRERVLIPLP